MLKSIRLSCGILGAALAVALAAGTARGEDGKLLRLKFTPGQTRHVVVNQDMTMNVKPRGDAPAKKMVMTQGIDMTMKVESVDAQGVASITETIDRIKLKVQSPQGVMLDYDSDSKKEPEGKVKMIAPLLGAMVHKPFRSKLTATGEVREAKGPQGFLEALNKVLGGNQGGGMFSEDMMKNMSGAAGFPEEPVTVGKTWNRKAAMKMPLIGELSIDSDFCYQGSENRKGRALEKIAVKMAIKMPEKIGAMGMRVKVDPSEGTMYFDNAAGWLAESDMKMKMTISLSVGEKKVDQDLEMTVHMEVKPAADAPKNDAPNKDAAKETAKP